MEENTQLSELFAQLFPDEEDQREASQYSFQTEGEIDNAIELVKDLEVEKERLNSLYKEKVEMLKFMRDSKVLGIENKIQWQLFNIKNTVKAAGDANETKTQFKKTYLAGDVIIKKSAIKLIKPELTSEQILANFPTYAKTETVITLDWLNLKKIVKIIDGEPINSVNGMNLSTIISTESTSEIVSVK